MSPTSPILASKVRTQLDLQRLPHWLKWSIGTINRTWNVSRRMDCKGDRKVNSTMSVNPIVLQKWSSEVKSYWTSNSNWNSCGTTLSNWCSKQLSSLNSSRRQNWSTFTSTKPIEYVNSLCILRTPCWLISAHELRSSMRISYSRSNSMIGLLSRQIRHSSFWLVKWESGWMQRSSSTSTKWTRRNAYRRNVLRPYWRQ